MGELIPAKAIIETKAIYINDRLSQKAKLATLQKAARKAAKHPPKAGQLHYMPL